MVSNVLLLIVTAHAADRELRVPDLKVENYTLPNGLGVILVVGDRGKVESSVKSLPFASTITFLDTKGNLCQLFRPRAEETDRISQAGAWVIR